MGHVQVLVSLALLGLLALTGAQAQKCPEQFNLVGNRCVNVSTEMFSYWNRPKPWNVFRKTCTRMSSHTWNVDFLSNFDVDFLRLTSMEIVNNYPELFKMGYIYWVGAEYGAEAWRWLDGTPVDPKSYIWVSGSPQNTLDPSNMVLVPAGGRRHYAVGRQAGGSAPAVICEAKPKN
ncbi:uncharacterized protein [Procambarus clarkii]|uniref:uncharacterized protein n=1 Tax=Procambarus clarkii TaxID=6728 RepID=UPI001E677537|nr:uncharacterized protein LOC123769675 [Procambarus clarkii]